MIRGAFEPDGSFWQDHHVKALYGEHRRLSV
jgi:hypothetical protein